MHDDVNDDDVLGALRHGLSKLPVPQAPPLEAIVARGRARRRRSGLAGMSLAVVGLAIALPVIITGVNAKSGRVATSPRLGSGPVHVNLAAYSVDSNANGTVSLTLATRGNFDPNRLRQALARAGVAAVVNIGAFCQTPVQPGGFTQVVSSAPLHGSATSGATIAGQSGPRANVTAMLIKPSAMPRRAELSIGYFPDHVAVTLIKLGGTLSCAASDPPGCNIPSAGRAQNASSASQGATSTVPSATTTTAGPSATSTVPPATTTVPPAATSTLPAGATTSLPSGAAHAEPPVRLRCQAPAQAGTGATSGTSGATSATVPSSTTAGGDV